MDSEPPDFSLDIVQGKSYDLDTGTGREIWHALEERLMASHLSNSYAQVSDGIATRMFADPTLARRRLGQGAFRILVTDSYQRQCAITSEHTLPVLEAAHIRPVTEGGLHAVSNGLLLRYDVHTLFDRGYVTVTPDFKFRVSDRLREDWQNGRNYYAQNNAGINLPLDRERWPSREALEWHADTVFLR